MNFGIPDIEYVVQTIETSLEIAAAILAIWALTCNWTTHEHR